MSRLCACCAHSLSFSARKPPMLASPSYLSDMVQPSAIENISSAMALGVWSA